MGLLDRLLSKLRRTEHQSPEAHAGLTDIIFDWFRDNNDSVDTFTEKFLRPCIQIYSLNEHTKKHIDTYPNYAYQEYFFQHALFYLAAKYPDNQRFKKLFDYLLDKKNQAYSISSSINNTPSRFDFPPGTEHFWQTLKTGNQIIKFYHAIHDERNPNISYLSMIPSCFINLLKPESKEIFTPVMAYFNQQEFEEKLLVLTNTVSYKNFDSYDSESLAIIQEEQKKALADYNNAKNIIQISDDLIQDFHRSVLNIQYTAKFKETDSRKVRYLSVKDFPEISQFIEKYASQKAAIIKYYTIQTGHTYLPSELLKIHKGFLALLIKRLQLSKNEFIAIINSKITSNKPLIYNKLLAPISYQVNQIDDDLINRFESKLLNDIETHQHGILTYQPAFDAILANRTNITNKIEKSLSIAKYNQLYGNISFTHNWLNLDFNSKKQANFSIQLIINRLNKIFSSSLKFLGKQIGYLSYEDILATFNINGADHNFTMNIFDELNKILASKKVGYRFLPIIIHRITPNPNNDPNLFNCSIELLNYEQFLAYKQNILRDKQLIKSNYIKNIKYHNLEAQLIDFHTNKERTNKKVSFQNNPRWKWFKDDYIDKLESSTKWYQLMDILTQCKGSAKPNKQWGKEISDAISIFGTERYFKELGSLISSSFTESFWFLDQYRTTIKGIIWSCALNPNAESLSIIKAITEAAYTKIPGIGPKSGALGNIGLNAFVLSGSDEAFGIMNLMRNKSKYQRFIKAIDRSIDKFLETTSGDPEELADKSIPDFGFIDGKKTITIDDTISALFFIKNRRMTKKWLLNGKIQSSTPTIIKKAYKAQEKEVASEFKRVNAIYKQLKDRIKTYWLYDRKWEFSNWLAQIQNHNLLFSYLSEMIWSNETNGQSFMLRDGKHLDFNDQKVNSKPKDIISLWHPITSNKTEISAWQKYIFTHKITQPFRQAFREHYPFSVQEAKATDSNRFAHHFLKVNKLMAIANGTGWIFMYEHEGQSWPRRYIKPLDLTIHLKCDYNRSDYAIPTKELFFTKGNTVNINTKKISKIQLSTIPLKTRSEVCRDMDLFIAITSIANDPELSLKTEQQEYYREEFNKGYFSDNATAKIRKQVISVIAPSLGLLPSFDKNFLIVQGKLNKYRINLGSGFAQLADSQKHINLLPDIKPMKKSKKVHAPIQDDETLYIILAKALFLEKDDKIDDKKFKEAISI